MKGSEGAGHEKTKLPFVAQLFFLFSVSLSGAGLLAGFIRPGEVAHLMQRDLHSPFSNRFV